MEAIKLSNNKKLNAFLTDIWEDLDALGIEEVERYMKEFPNEPDFNIAQYGNGRVYYDDIAELFEKCGYKNPEQYASGKGWETYIRNVGYVARRYRAEHRRAARNSAA